MSKESAVVSSVDIAEDFGKQHKHVLSTIDKIIKTINNRKVTSQLFVESTYTLRGREYRQYLMGRDGFFLVTMGFTGSYALHKKLEYLATFENGITNGLIDSINNQTDTIKELQILLTQSGVVKPCVNPRYTFENLVTRWKQCTGIDRVRTFYDQIGDWFGIKVPYSDSINITVREWILMNVPIEELQELVAGLETGIIKVTPRGHLVSLKGVFGNSVEWEKVKKEFNNSCAYCGKTGVALIPEHIVPQSVLAKTHPDKVDLIGNIVPACKECNGSKLRQHMQTWYHAQPFFSDERYWKLCEHIEKYEVA